MDMGWGQCWEEQGRPMLSREGAQLSQYNPWETICQALMRLSSTRVTVPSSFILCAGSFCSGTAWS